MHFNFKECVRKRRVNLFPNKAYGNVVVVGEFLFLRCIVETLTFVNMQWNFMSEKRHNRQSVCAKLGTRFPCKIFGANEVSHRINHWVHNGFFVCSRANRLVIFALCYCPVSMGISCETCVLF